MGPPPLPAGSGTVNVQFGAFAYEKFKINTDSNEISTIESNFFPGVFLRLDGTGVTKPLPNGGGVVNAQFGAFAFEKFKIKPT